MMISQVFAYVQAQTVHVKYVQFLIAINLLYGEKQYPKLNTCTNNLKLHKEQ